MRLSSPVNASAPFAAFTTSAKKLPRTNAIEFSKTDRNSSECPRAIRIAAADAARFRSRLLEYVDGARTLRRSHEVLPRSLTPKLSECS